MLPLFDADQARAIEGATAALDRFPALYERYWLDGMRAKLGLFTADARDQALADDLLAWMQATSADFTNTFRTLASPVRAEAQAQADPAFGAWYARLQDRWTRQAQSASEVQVLLRRSNPVFIPRNHKVEEALEAATLSNDLSVMDRLLDVLADPYDHDRDLPAFSAPAPAGRPYQTFCGT
jgi:uncharacterized protein YdiU (UPF0061 family)